MENKTQYLTLKNAFTSSIPVMMGYVILGFAFGLLAVKSGFSLGVAVAMSLFIYAGALQFAAISFLSAKLGFLEIAISSLLINIRQSFYGLSLIKKFNQSPFKERVYLIFGLTDETYGLLTSVDEKSFESPEKFRLYLTLLNQSYWVSGTLLGALLGQKLEFNSQGIDFSLTALFVVLAIEQFKKLRETTPLAIAILCSVAVLLWVPSKHFLIVSIVASSVSCFLYVQFFKQRDS